MNPDPHHPGEDALAEYLDGPPEAAERVDLGGVPREELLNALLADGVARHLLSTPRAALHETVRAGMAAVAADDRARRRGGRIGRWLAAAAAIVITAMLLWRQPDGVQPALQRMHEFVTADADRTYDVAFEFGEQVVPLLPLRIEVVLRGTRSFFASTRPRLPALRDQQLEVLQGYDGEEYWLMLPDFAAAIGNLLGRDPGRDQGRDTRSPVIVSKEGLAACFGAQRLGRFDQILRGLDRIEVGLKIFQVLDELDRRYRIEVADPTQTAFTVTEGRLALLATRDPETPPTFPETIEILLDEKTGAVEQLSIRYRELPEVLGQSHPFRRIRFALAADQFPRPRGFFGHAAHHAPDHPVRYAK